MEHGPQTVSKGEFACLCGVTPACVSRWIARGYIGGGALSGKGPRAKIVLGEALDQLIKHFANARANKFSGIITFARRMAGNE